MTSFGDKILMPQIASNNIHCQCQFLWRGACYWSQTQYFQSVFPEPIKAYNLGGFHKSTALFNYHTVEGLVCPISDRLQSSMSCDRLVLGILPHKRLLS